MKGLVLHLNFAPLHQQACDLVAGRRSLADFLVRLEQSLNQRHLFLVKRVAQLQKKLETAP